MKPLTYDEKIKLIKNHYKKNKLFLELYYLNYENYHIYIRIDETKRNIYKIRWFDLDLIENEKIEIYESTEYIKSEIINNIKNNLLNISIDKEDYSYEEDRLVKLYVNTKISNKENISIKFNRYLPKEISFLSDIFIFIFNNLPRKLELFIEETLAEIFNNTIKFEYKRKFKFDLLKGDLTKIFNKNEILEGEKYYQENKIKFLEEINGKYFAIVEEKQKYVVVIDYDSENKTIQLLCSCPCEFFCRHMYATILAIRNKEYKRFFKISYKKDTKNLLEKMMNFNYFLCIGIIDNYLEIINSNGMIQLANIYDKNNKIMWKIIEDNEKEELSKMINKL